MSFRRTRAIARKEFLHILRDVRSLLAAIAQPVLMLLLFGYALSLDVDRIPTIVYDLDRTPVSDSLIKDFRGSRYFEIVEEARDYRPIEKAMDSRKALLGVVIPKDYSRNLASGKDTQVQLLLDGSDSNTASIAMGYAEGLIQAYAQRQRDRAQIERTGATVGLPVEPRVRVWYNTDLVSRDYIVPGLIAVILMIIAALLTSLTIAREWENGTMEQLLSTPVRPVEMALGKLSAYFVLGIVDMLIALAVGVGVFHVPMKGSWTLLFASSCVFLFGALSWGIFISAMNRSQLNAYQFSTLTSFLPAFLLSGFIYSIGNMPYIIQFVALFVPARYFINIIKGVFLKGTGLELLWFDFLLLVIYGLGVFYFATKKLRQKVA
ncbi:MAG: ABC transporter permease [Bryobacterales bacterium]|nr:ABC transporter permease [Bryobacterales bacterium]MBV9400783.1 ABC transporter permease [Bryobacterales bacterium]